MSPLPWLIALIAVEVPVMSPLRFTTTSLLFFLPEISARTPEQPALPFISAWARVTLPPGQSAPWPETAPVPVTRMPPLPLPICWAIRPRPDGPVMVPLPSTTMLPAPRSTMSAPGGVATPPRALPVTEPSIVTVIGPLASTVRPIPARFDMEPVPRYVTAPVPVSATAPSLFSLAATAPSFVKMIDGPAPFAPPVVWRARPAPCSATPGAMVAKIGAPPVKRCVRLLELGCAPFVLVVGRVWVLWSHATTPVVVIAQAAHAGFAAVTSGIASRETADQHLRLMKHRV